MAETATNKYRMGANMGRPAHYENPEELAAACQDYFDWCNTSGTKTTITGLTLYLGFCSRSSLDDYSNRSTDFSYIVKRAKLAVENGYELSGQVIDIFALKNMGWKDRTETAHTDSEGNTLPPPVINVYSNKSLDYETK
jgi:hypothetical protein